MRSSVGRRMTCDLGISRCRCTRCVGTGSETLRQDREAIILADQLGFYDAFVGEHLTDRCENVTNSMMFLATLIPDTRQIKLATGTANIAQNHPVLTAAQAAMFDHLAQGRFVFGISPGALTSDAEAIGHPR